MYANVTLSVMMRARPICLRSDAVVRMGGLVGLVGGHVPG